MLFVVNPSTLVLDGLIFGALGGIGVISLTMAFLKKLNQSVTDQWDKQEILLAINALFFIF